MESSKPDRIIRRPEMTRLTGWSGTTLWRKVRANEFPEPIKLSESGRLIGWRESVYAEWLDSRPRASTSSTPPAEAAGL